MKIHKFAGGFTLIELLVVIAIISLLSSVIFASLNTARGRAKDSAIKTEMRQFVTLLELEYNEIGSYLGLQPNANTWYNSAANCTSGFPASNYRDKAREICAKVVELNGGTGSIMHVGISTPLEISNKFSVMARLPNAGRHFCIGSSGRSSDTETGLSNPYAWDDPGCFRDP